MGNHNLRNKKDVTNDESRAKKKHSQSNNANGENVNARRIKNKKLLGCENRCRKINLPGGCRTVSGLTFVIGALLNSEQGVNGSEGLDHDWIFSCNCSTGASARGLE